MNPHQEKILQLLDGKTKVIALLAPSFPIDFPYPQIIGMLKKLGFEKVTELTFGARMVNYWYQEYITSNPDQKHFITSPCPTIKMIIEKQYPDLVKYLIPFNSPVISMAKICKKYYPEYKIVFFSPCQAKRILEVSEFPELVDETITFKELGEIFATKGIKTEDFKNQEYEFDSFITESTKIYPISGGLANSSNIKSFFYPHEICITDGFARNKEILEDLKNGNSEYKFIDILNCPGGCIGGPDIINHDLSHLEKNQIIKNYRDSWHKKTPKNPDAKKELALDVDIRAN